jgi:hypothetical protein
MNELYIERNKRGMRRLIFSRLLFPNYGSSYDLFIFDVFLTAVVMTVLVL